MPRSQCESENVQFVQELAEVDGPFESPININFRDLTKLELPSLVWNRGDTCPKKMKITNTGHTVIISGKWKCERPYLTGGPLQGKYVFSQIHFHWGQDDCRGSEHQVCGDGFPLEMHVAHFKTEYLTQECALREKDGMVVLVYLFKLQDEPNQSLKKIISLLPCVKQPSTSHAIDPKPILSFINPFTDDYFMYWGSVVTSTCAHILLWIICREPFGISRDQVNEFRKIMDSCQQPICRNSRDIQPLHRRNVFHVNASKHLDNPLLPVKKILGCFCKESGENVANTIQQPPQDCTCQRNMQKQEECEGDIVEYTSGSHCVHAGGVEPMHLEVEVPSGCFHHNQTYFVHRATVHSVSLLVKRLGSEPVGSHSLPEKSTQLSAENKLLSRSCCFLPLNECKQIKPEKRAPRVKRPFNSLRAFSQILHSLEALKNHTFKKLKEIEAINQEIDGMKPYCHGNEDKKWLRRIEKMMKRQKRLTIKSSQGCLTELKKLAKDCNLDKIFECKTLPVNGNNGKLVWLCNNDMTKENVCSPNTYVKQEEIPVKEKSKTILPNKAIKFSAKAQKLIQSFFEDIQDSDEIQENVKKDLSLKKMKSICAQAGDSNSVSNVIKGFITPNMFLSGNLGNRFFTEVTTDDPESDESKWKIKAEEEIAVTPKIIEDEDSNENKEKETESETSVDEIPSLQSLSSKISHKDTVDTTIPKAEEDKERESWPLENIGDYEISNLEDTGDMKATATNGEKQKKSERLLRDSEKQLSESSSQKQFQTTETNYYEEDWLTSTNCELNVHRSSSNLSTDSAEIQRMIIAKIRKRQSRRDFWEQNSSDRDVKSCVLPYERSGCKEFENCYIYKKNQKTKKRKKQKGEQLKLSSSRETSSLTTGTWKSLTKAKFKLEIEKTGESLVDIEFENSLISPKRKKIRLESQKGSPRTPRESNQKNSSDDEEDDIMLIAGPRLEGQEVSKVTEKHSPKDRTEWNTDRERTLTDSSADSKISFGVTKDADEESYQASEDGNNTINAEFPKPAESKTRVRSRSLASLPTEPKNLTGAVQRLYVESLDDRRQNSIEVTDLIAQMKSPKKTGDRPQPKKDFSRATLSEIYDSDGEEKSHEISETSSNKLEYSVGYFITASDRMDEELKPSDENVIVKNPALKRCDAEKYQFLEKKTLEIYPTFTDPKEDYLLQTDSNKSFAKDAFKGDSVPQNIGKELQTSVPYFRLKNIPPSRPHSAETLSSLRKTFKRKGKKRPHCRKRISRHYIRKNSSIIKKPHKTESKQVNFMNLTDQEQLKIISVNVAKYLKQKLIEENKELDPEKIPIENIEEAVLKNLEDQGSTENKPPKVTDTSKNEKTKPNKIPRIKPRTKKTEKVTQSESKTKTEPSKSSKIENEQKIEKPPVGATPKSGNNFIKLNKQMAGKYKKMAPSPSEKKAEPKQKEKPVPEKTTKEETGKFKTKIPKVKVDKNAPKTQEQAKAVPETPPSKNQKTPGKATKESRIKSPGAKKKTESNKKENKKETATASPSNAPEEPNELVACEQKQSQNALEDTVVEEVPEEKPQQFISACTVTSYLPAPVETAGSQQTKVNRYVLGMGNPDLEKYLPDVLCDNKGKMTTDGNELVKKELEYFIKLEMLDISANIEKSMNYVRSNLSQEYFGSNNIESNPPEELDSLNKEIVLLKMKDLENTSSVSDFVEDTDKYTPERDLLESKSLDKIEDIVTVKIPKESAEPEIVSPTVVRERQDETNSDSSYDCKISITLNTNFNVDAQKNEAVEAAQSSEVGNSEMLNNDECDSQTANSDKQAVGHSDTSNPQSPKQQRRKRKENEISLEMKHKLLEILEGEIRREVGIKGESSSGNSSEGINFKWDDSERNPKSQSTVSSCDNIDVLTQISDTMRQYLQTLKENGQLVEVINDSSDKESK